MDNELQLVFGLITDIQYAECEDGMTWDKKRVRYYENSLNLVAKAFDYWKDIELKTNQKLKFIIQLGDLLDLKAKQSNLGSIESMNRVLSKLNEYKVDLLHIWGNHEFYNFNRSDLVELPLNTARYLNQNIETNANYYSYELTDNLTMICLDFYDLAVIGYENDPTNDLYLKCLNLLKQYNKNENLNKDEGLLPGYLHYLAFNGGIGSIQLNWLKEQLSKCKQTNKRAIVCGHVPLDINASNSNNKALNSDEILDLLWSFDTTVVAYLCGHFHPGGYYKESRNSHSIHHITFESIVETVPESKSFSTVKIYKNRISIEQINNDINVIEIDI